MEIKLSRVWSYDPNQRLGRPGGFGDVFAGEGEGFGPVAVKRLRISARETGYREMRIADHLSGKKFKHVLEILDSGLDAESDCYYVIMPRAECSLQTEIDRREPFSDQEAANVLRQIADGLAEVPEIAHRDLKPDNILKHESNWKLADYGIARFVEESTSLATLKSFLTFQYAAPEQWLFEHATGATDIYALGCIAYALLTGSPPFSGPTMEEFRAQHLHHNPPPLDHHSARLRSIVGLMLRKNPNVRPSLRRIRDHLSQFLLTDDMDSGGKSGELARAAATIAERESLEEAELLKEKNRLISRDYLASEGIQILDEMWARMMENIRQDAPNVRIEHPAAARLGKGLLKLSILNSGRALTQDPLPESKWDIIAGAVVMVSQSALQYTWSASLWFMKSPGGGEYRWHEMSYFSFRREDYQTENAPFALTDLKEVDHVASPIISGISYAESPRLIDGEDEENFFIRWKERFAKASEGRLAHPHTLPIR